jgi:hypothetical protein
VVLDGIVRKVNEKLLEVLGQSGLKKAIAVGIAADVVHYEEVLGGIPAMPIELLREGLAEKGLMLPALVRTVR